MRCRKLLLFALLLAGAPALADTTGEMIIVLPADLGGAGDVEAVWGCASGDCSTLTAAAGDSIDAGAADSSRPTTRSSTLPGTCMEGQLHQDTDAGGSELYVCTTTDAWTKLGADGAAPASHAASHQYAGSDEISVAGLSGLLADPQTPAAHALVSATHTASGLTTGHVLRAIGATSFGFAPVEDGDLPATIARDSELHPQQHALDGADHTLAGATDGQSLQATGATTFAFRWARTRRHATDCTGLTDGAAGEICYEDDADRWFVCEPTAGACDTASEWRPLTIDGSQVTSGTVATARLGSGTADSTTFLRGDQTWAAPAAGASLTVEEADGAPTVASVDTVQFNQADGFRLVDETGGNVQVDLLFARLLDLDGDGTSEIGGTSGTNIDLDPGDDGLTNGLIRLLTNVSDPAIVRRDSAGDRCGIAFDTSKLEIDCDGSFGGGALSEWDNTSLRGVGGTGPAVKWTNASATVPVYAFRSDLDTGVGEPAVDDLRLIAAGSSVLGAARASAINTTTFYGGGTRHEAQATPPVTCNAGNLGYQYTDTSPALCWCDGSAWVVVAGGGSCS